MTDPGWWLDPKSAWQAKMARAKEHIDSLRAEVDEFIRERFSYEEIPGANPNETDYVLRMSGPIPVRFSTIIGDALQNMRSALDCVAFELARRHIGRPLTEEEERACEFPVRDELQKVDAFFTQGRLRPQLYGPRERRAIRDVQPGWLHDEIVRHASVPPGVTREEAVAQDQLMLLVRLNNVDKHRTLHLTAPALDLVFWMSDTPTSSGWRQRQPPFDDGDVLGTLITDPKRPEPKPELNYKMELRLFEPPAVSTTDVVRLLEEIHSYVQGWVMPRVLNPYWLDSDGRTAQEAAADASVRDAAEAKPQVEGTE